MPYTTSLVVNACFEFMHGAVCSSIYTNLYESKMYFRIVLDLSRVSFSIVPVRPV